MSKKLKAEFERVRDKLKARQGKPGFGENLEAIVTKVKGYTFRDRKTGEFVEDEFALANPDKIDVELFE